MVELTHYLSSHDRASTHTSSSNQRQKVGMDSLRRSLPNISNLDPISSHDFERSSTSLYRRTDMTVTRLTYCLNKFHHLRVVKLHQLDQMGDKFLPIINASAMRHTLTHLELHNVRILKNGHVMVIPEDSRLSHVEISGAMFCNYEVIQSFTTSPNLEVLKLIGCRALLDRDVKDIIQRQNGNRKLRELRLNNCTKLVAPSIDCPTLEALHLGRCNMLKDLSMIKCENLITVDLSYCCALGDDDIEQIMNHNRRVEVLSLHGSNGFTKIDVQSDFLREVNLGLCMGLKNCKIVANNLKSLKLDMCVKLQDVHLEVNTIEYLDLSMLTMEKISITAAEIVKLKLEGCCKLASVDHFLCPKLTDLDICGTLLEPDMFELSRKTKIKSGGEADDWSNPFGH